MTRAVLSIGSNMGDRSARLRDAVAGFGADVVAVSSVYTTAPWGGVDQDDFLNIVAIVDNPTVSCRDWLLRGQELERAADRVREVRWGARTLDIDVVWCADGDRVVRSADPELILPHPHAHERAFVLLPWLEVAPDAVLTVDAMSRPISDWLAALDPAERAGVRRTESALGVAPEFGSDPAS
ncbi:2-amino-4-hydroxy-6-hydroxymethyldihydropteridine diphosphokinase [Nocardia panacis]|uniref:2-amino-4-hydroxy-6-hydroxymethyldihydropteridine diphosphokinase n=1 Tax=Nocardia panacis TaxID=2340916 RepID=A0A3A4K8V8_9NOCA|nr:2-amino-4-hydroxy-6-hydroxymethyldihydropteridine diphosphokinase [Nocardia panacis]RJO77887.1 2-amino-4-hydroxy-6-hydroxymethyldihydropteridine diphosphokinase [Nocardia panacis]